MVLDDIFVILEAKKIKYEKDYDLSRASTFKVGGRISVAVFPKSVEELVSAFELFDRNNIRCEVVGKASNVLFGDGNLFGAIIFTGGVCNWSFDGTKIFTDAGASFTMLAKKAADMGLSGLEFAYGIPGTVGGAVYMNAGAYGSCVSNVLVSSKVYDRQTGNIFDILLDEHDFDYRKSTYMDNPSYVCLGAVFELVEGNKDEIYSKMDSFITSRKEKQPLELPNAGSYFKRPEGYFAGKLIEDCGLKGYRIGNAAVSEKHAGFIVNLGGASAQDILALEEAVRIRVYEQFGVILEREVKTIF